MRECNVMQNEGSKMLEEVKIKQPDGDIEYRLSRP